MRLLLVAPQVPWPPRQGTAIRNYNIARELARRHDVTLVAFGPQPGREDPLCRAGVTVVAVPPPHSRSTARRALGTAVDPIPDLARRTASPEMRDAIASLAGAVGPEAFDLVQVEGLEMALHGLRARDLGGAPPPLVYDGHNAEWLLQDRAWRTDAARPAKWHGALYSRIQTAKLRRFERRLVLASDAVIAVSDADADALRALAPHAPITVVPNGVDIDHYAPCEPARSEPGLCVFTGKMDFRPNVDAMEWFCDRVWPAVRAAQPGARLEIVGRDPTARVRALQAPDIRVVGEVDDVRDFLCRASVVVAPLRVGGGTRLKVLEAMASARPVAATALAVEGLRVRPGEDLLVADGAVGLADAVGRLLVGPDLAARVGRNARARVEADYQWRALVPRIEDVHRRAVAGRA